MKKGKKTVCMCMVALLSCLVVGTTAFAATKTTTYSYNVGTTYVALVTNTLTKSGTMTWSTRPTSGQGGAMMWVAGSDGSSTTHGFPYQVSVSPMTVSMKKNVSYTSHIKGISGTVKGNASQTITY